MLAEDSVEVKKPIAISAKLFTVDYLKMLRCNFGKYYYQREISGLFLFLYNLVDNCFIAAYIYIYIYIYCGESIVCHHKN